MACDPATTITSAELSGLNSDIQTIDDVVESSLDTTTTKNGKTINTLLGQLKLLGYLPPVTYAGSIVFGSSDNTKTIDRNGIIYAPKPTELPFTTSGTWTADDENKFFVIQSVTLTSDQSYSYTAGTVANMLSATDIVIGQRVVTKGYSTAGDGGGAEYLAVPLQATDGFGDHSSATLSFLIQADSINVKQFGAKGDGVTDDLLTVRAAMARAKITKEAVYFPGGATYGFSDELFHRTSDALGSTSSKNNGIVLVSDSVNGCTFKALPGFPAATAIIDLDGNENSETVVANAVQMNGCAIMNITLDCNNVAQRALRTRAVSHSYMRNVTMKNVAGGANDAAWLITSSAAVGNDDVDTTAHWIIDNLIIQDSTGFGVLCVANRCATMLFNNADIRGCTYDGMRMAFAGLTLNACTVASNGSSVSNSTGGVNLVKANTGAVNRGFVANNLQCEANFNHDLNIDWCDGYTINGGLLTPFERAAAGQAVCKIGTGAIGSSRVTGGVINGPRVANYATTGPVIEGFVIGSNTRGLEINNVSWGESGSNWYTKAQRFTIDPAASDIVINEETDTAFAKKPLFSTGIITNANPVANITGDGTEYTSANLATATTSVISVNQGPQRETHAITSAGISGDILTVTAITGTPLAIGNRITGNGTAENTFITDFITGGGGTGTYRVSISQEIPNDFGMLAWSSQWYDRLLGTFIAPNSGFYDFETSWPLTGFAGTETDIEVAFIVDPAGTPIRHIVAKESPKSLAGADVNIYGGSKKIHLAAGQEVQCSIKVSGGGKVVDLYRNIAQPGGFRFAAVQL